MSFVLNLTSRGATGREIVRTRRVDADVLTIGRDPASDIHLTDLEVTRRHAEIRRIGPQRVAIHALASIPLLVDGRSVSETEIDAARGGEIRIGAARIAIAAGEEPDTIAVSVSRDSAPLEGADDTAERFSLSGVAFGKRSMAWTFGLAILAIFLIWPIWSFHMMPAKLTPEQMASGYRHIGESWSSGPLSKAHASLTGNCKACHVDAFVAVPDKACASCHSDVAGHADPRRLALNRPRPDGFAGFKLAVADMFGRDPGRCVDCHGEHSGPGRMPSPTITCVSCHADLKANLPDTRLGDASDFGRVHPELQATVMTTPGDYPRFTRVSLGSPATANVQDSGLKFPHALHMSRSGGVARMQFTLGRKPLDCAECHVADASGARFRPVEMERNCSQCHSLALTRVGGRVLSVPHGDTARAIAAILALGGRGGASPPGDGRPRPGQIATTPLYSAGNGAVAMVRAAFSPRGVCYDCHVVTQPRDGEIGYGIVPVAIVLGALCFLGAGKLLRLVGRRLLARGKPGVAV